ncbi:hypothetical protein G5I_11881 [Acromyrmex echinatior]|uniref:Uncharacterized protein n=1 Tax=Acromyrmex echinatior TaxID=103372 RepID=F4X0T3_ACREC|nr:hypothetical protein G5I_11881 [Acromyrmex echinatior]
MVIVEASKRKLDIEESDTLDSKFNLKGEKRCININLTEGNKHNHENISDNTTEQRFINRLCNEPTKNIEFN